MNNACSLLAAAAIGIFVNLQADAGAISDYVLDPSTQIVTDTANNLEWLQWSATTYKSVNYALAIYSGLGWGLATNDQMANLFNTFDLSYGAFEWDSDENTTQLHYSPVDGITESANDRELIFVSLFGDTNYTYDANNCSRNDCMQYSAAFFGEDQDGDGFYNIAKVFDDYGSGIDWENQERQGHTTIEEDGYITYTKSRVWAGVALVRQSVSPVRNEIPNPSSSSLLTLGIAALILFRTRRFCHDDPR